MDRNDGPAIDLGGGIDMDFMVTYIENGQSVAITIAHLLDLMGRRRSRNPGHVILVIITVTDVNFESTVVRVGIEIQPVNDNAPVLFIDSDPAACSQDYRDEDVVISRSRRDVRFVSKQRRKRMASGNIDTSWVSDSVVVDSCNKEVYNTTAERERKKLCASTTHTRFWP